MSANPESTRPAWTINNAGAFNYWMRTGASELPANWIDDGDILVDPHERHAHSRRSDKVLADVLALLDEIAREQSELRFEAS